MALDPALVRPTVALMSDFGNSDGYAGVMKGVLLNLCPEARLIDVSHQISSFSISSAAYVLYTLWDWYPPGTIFLSVVDPGVGSQRRECLATDGTRLVVTPDNGTLGLLQGMYPELRCFRASGEVLEDLYTQKPSYSSTFDGRDLFAPLAGRAAAGLRDLGPSLLGDNFMFSVVQDLAGHEIQPMSLPLFESRGREGVIMHVDFFGNCITTIHVNRIRPSGGNAAAVVDYRPYNRSGNRPGNEGSEKTAISLVSHFGAVPKGYPLAYWGSYGFLEVAIREGNCANELSLSVGDPVSFLEVSLDEEKPVARK